MLALRTVPGHEGRVEVVYSLEPEHWGRGVATAAAAEVLAHGFDGCGLEEILGGVDAPNFASAAVLRRLGMVPIGPLLIDGDVVHFSTVDRATFAAVRPGLPTLAALDVSDRQAPG